MSYGEIVAATKTRLGVRLPKSSISDWVSSKHNPYGSVRPFSPSPTPELAYVIGVMKGDGNLSRQRWNYRIRLRVTDLDFVEEFNRCISVILSCDPHPINFIMHRRQWSLEVSSILLYRFLKQPMVKLKVAIEHSEKCLASFIRGFFDSEGSASPLSISCSNNSYALLVYIKKSLRLKFGIECTGPLKHGQPPGTTKMIKGVLRNVNRQNYSLRIRRTGIGEFQSRIGFSIGRKMNLQSIGEFGGGCGISCEGAPPSPSDPRECAH